MAAPLTADPNAYELTEDQKTSLRNWLESHDKPAVASGYQASIYLYNGPEGDFVIKEALGSFLRRRVSEASIRREARVYRLLRGISGIPRCYGLLDERYLVLEHICGDSYRALQTRIDDREHFFARLLNTLKAMHEAGVAHGDLKRKDNILVGPGQQPYVIDFGIAIASPNKEGFVFNTVRKADYNAWIKHKYQGKAAELSAEDKELHKPMILESLARTIRITWQTLTLRRLRNRNRVR